MDQGWWSGRTWKTLSGATPHLCSRSCIRHLWHRKNKTLLVVGDSTMRFLYAAILHILKVNHSYPHHWLPPNDVCAFERVGWPVGGPCATRWRGPCRDNRHGCTYSHAWHKINLVFVWWRNNLPLTLPVRDVDLLLSSTGVWEAMGNKNSSLYRSAVRVNMQRILSTVTFRRAIVFSNGICLQQSKDYFKNFSGWPSVGMEERIMEGNQELSQVAQSNRVLFFDRTWSMLTGDDISSPCVYHHPYGKSSELHASFALAHLLLS